MSSSWLQSREIDICQIETSKYRCSSSSSSSSSVQSFESLLIDSCFDFDSILFQNKIAPLLRGYKSKSTAAGGTFKGSGSQLLQFHEGHWGATPHLAFCFKTKAGHKGGLCIYNMIISFCFSMNRKYTLICILVVFLAVFSQYLGIVIIGEW